MLGLVVKSPWVELIRSCAKTWEIRGRATNVRGNIALIRGGSGSVVGVCRLDDCRGPLDPQTFQENFERHRVAVAPGVPLMYPKPYAWVLADARSLPEPLPYKHPSGAVTWVRLSEDTYGRRLPAAARLHGRRIIFLSCAIVSGGSCWCSIAWQFGQTGRRSRTASTS